MTTSVPALGRETELAALAGLLDAARLGTGGALVIRGEPGVGKSLLLATVMDGARDLTLLSATGVQSESDLAFGALSTLLRPLFDGIDGLPAIQADSLRAAVGLASQSHVEQLPCHAGVVSLLAAAAATRPVLVVADDLQWFDAASRDAILFAARRLASDAVAVVMAVRDGDTEEPLHTGLTELHLSGLAQDPALALVARGAGEVSPAVARRLWAQTAGNPLALVEIPRNLSAGQRSGR
ncbi:MAG: ATP-binding protein, partial [Solirubrobacteraceae bacterium]